MENKVFWDKVQQVAVKVNGEVEEICGALILKIKSAYAIETLNMIKSFTDVPCDFLHDLTALDKVEHFEVVYQLSSLRGSQRLRVKAIVDRQNPVIDSVTRIWQGANFLEREAFDMFGIQFKGHPNLKRIYLWDDFVGYPLRKDYVQESLAERCTVLERKEGD
ncbi:MAG: NADH-quinone oxidoreductase subunit C [Desulfitobacteriaceae bacterium]